MTELAVSNQNPVQMELPGLAAPASAPAKKTRMSKNVQPGMKKLAAAFTAGDRTSRELASWRPNLNSADQDMLPEKDLTEGRALDLVRNNGYAAGAVQSVKDRIVGHYFRVVHQPDYRTLGMDREVLREWAKIVEGMFHAWADDPMCNVDAQRKRTFTEFLRDAEASKFIQGEAFISREFRFQPFNQSSFGTCFQLIEPERVVQPPSTSLEKVRAGIEFDAWGAPVAYHIRTQHPADFQSGYSRVIEWQRVTKFNSYGWLQLIHVFDQQRANQTRGFSKFAPILQKLKMSDRHHDVTLELSIISAALAIVIESQFGPQSSLEALGASPMQSLSEYVGAQTQFKKASPVVFDGVKIPHLFPGEKLNVSRAEPPGQSFREFENSILRHVAKGLNMSYESLSGDYTQTTYSSARAALSEAWSSVLSARESGPIRVATHIFRLWLREGVTRGLVPLPPGVDLQAYLAKETLFSRCNWIGAGKSIVDEKKSAESNKILLDSNLTTLSAIAADRGEDFEDILEQRAEEQRLMAELGISNAPSTTQPQAQAAAEEEADEEQGT
jgi:lambda family phage portal protein